MILHTVNRPPSAGVLRECLAHALPGSGILLLEDGVYAAQDTPANRVLAGQFLESHRWYALRADLEARGLADRVMEGIEAVDYPGFVALCCEYAKVQNWN